MDRCVVGSDPAFAAAEDSSIPTEIQIARSEQYLSSALPSSSPSAPANTLHTRDEAHVHTHTRIDHVASASLAPRDARS